MLTNKSQGECIYANLDMSESKPIEAEKRGGSCAPPKATKRNAAFTEPPPDMDVNDPRWPEAFAAWAERKAKHFGMDAMEMMGRALGCDIEADAWRKKRQAALRHQEQHANDIYGKPQNKQDPNWHSLLVCSLEEQRKADDLELQRHGLRVCMACGSHFKPHHGENICQGCCIVKEEE